MLMVERKSHAGGRGGISLFCGMEYDNPAIRGALVAGMAVGRGLRGRGGGDQLSSVLNQVDWSPM